MKMLSVNLGDRSHPIIITDSFHGIGKAVQKHASRRGAALKKVLVVTNPLVRKWYGEQVEKELEQRGISVSCHVMPDGEKFKTLETVKKIYAACVRNRLDRSSCIVALGGGVVGDVAAFAASTYLRGIAVVQVPTTLLAMVDSSIGGKTGVDLPEAKNFVGAFHQPRLVWINTGTLRTLNSREFNNGMAEVVKYGMIADPRLFSLLEKNAPLAPSGKKLLQAVIARCAAIKADVVSRDEKETKGLREILNFGHTLGHAVETLTQYRVYKHGEAVSLGMCAAGWMAEVFGILTAGERVRLEILLQQSGLPVRLKRPLDKDRVLVTMLRDKKFISGEVRFVLPVSIGKVNIQKIPAALAMEGLLYIQTA